MKIKISQQGILLFLYDVMAAKTEMSRAELKRTGTLIYLPSLYSIKTVYLQDLVGTFVVRDENEFTQIEDLKRSYRKHRLI